MKKKALKKLISGLGLVALGITGTSSVYGFDLNKALNLEGTFTGSYQYLNESSGNFDDHGRVTGIIDLGLSFTPTENDEFFILGSFASGDGIGGVDDYPFVIAPYADDFKSDLENINGHENQDNILEAWYAHTFNLGNLGEFKFTVGIIDATVYIDDNEIANDEVTQFMNDAFVNTPVTTPPSYDFGVVLEYNIGNFNIKGLYMNTKNEDDRYYNYYAVQLSYHVNIPSLGEGNYRIYGFLTDDKFPSSEKPDELESIQGIGVSIDQEFIKDRISAFIRASVQDTDPEVDYQYFISGGLAGYFSYKKEKDITLAIGYGYLSGDDDTNMDYGHVVEAYLKYNLFETQKLSSDITLDFQYIYEEPNTKKQPGEEDRSGYIYGIRWNLSF